VRCFVPKAPVVQYLLHTGDIALMTQCTGSPGDNTEAQVKQGTRRYRFYSVPVGTGYVVDLRHGSTFYLGAQVMQGIWRHRQHNVSRALVAQCTWEHRCYSISWV
jgi:hypothetical protein